MGFILFAAFVGIPLIEIAVFIAVGQNIGLWPTLGLILLTAAVGSGMLRAQGLSTLFRAQQSARQGQLPITELFEGMYLLIAGVLLLTPGFVTDAIGLMLFVPGIRRWLGEWLLRTLRDRGRFHVVGGDPDHGPDSGGGPVIDGDIFELSDRDSGPPDEDDPQSVVRR